MSGQRAAEADFRYAIALAIQSNVPLHVRGSARRNSFCSAEKFPKPISYPTKRKNSSLLAEAQAVRCTVRLTQSRFDEATLDTGMVAVESRLVSTLITAAFGNPTEAQKQLSVIETETEQRSLYFYSHLARQVREALMQGVSIPVCISIAMGSHRIPK